MNLRHRRSEAPEINLTSLIDVVLLLIIFFILATTFEKNSQLAIELPEASAEPPETPPASIEVSIDVQGRFFVDGRELINTQPATLRQALVAAAAVPGRKGAPLVLSADAATPHQAVVAVMDAARRVGLTQLTFATRFEDEEAGGSRP